jgi:hypothetical protein
MLPFSTAWSRKKHEKSIKSKGSMKKVEEEEKHISSIPPFDDIKKNVDGEQKHYLQATAECLLI